MANKLKIYIRERVRETLGSIKPFNNPRNQYDRKYKLTKVGSIFIMVHRNIAKEIGLSIVNEIRYPRNKMSLNDLADEIHDSLIAYMFSHIRFTIPQSQDMCLLKHIVTQSDLHVKSYANVVNSYDICSDDMNHNITHNLIIRQIANESGMTQSNCDSDTHARSLYDICRLCKLKMESWKGAQLTKK